MVVWFSIGLISFWIMHVLLLYFDSILFLWIALRLWMLLSFYICLRFQTSDKPKTPERVLDKSLTDTNLDDLDLILIEREVSRISFSNVSGKVNDQSRLPERRSKRRRVSTESISFGTSSNSKTTTKVSKRKRKKKSRKQGIKKKKKKFLRRLTYSSSTHWSFWI